MEVTVYRNRPVGRPQRRRNKREEGQYNKRRHGRMLGWRILYGHREMDDDDDDRGFITQYGVH